MARIVELIQTTITIGHGTAEDPYRAVVQYWEKDGRLLFEVDRCDIKVNDDH